MPVMVNPSGTVFNPVSVCNTIKLISSGKKYGIEDLHFYDGTWLSFYHYTNFSSDDPAKVLEKINRQAEDAVVFLKNAGFLFLTLGTARVYQLKKTGLIVSNCHKIPSDQFVSRLLSADEIVKILSDHIDKISTINPDLKIIFTISPVRHWKDGAHGNQVSKSVLFVAVEQMLRHKAVAGYFPAYELMMDDLRDYRFYGDDMLHPSASAVNYIWEAFMKCYFDNATISLWKEISKLSKAFNHRVTTDSSTKKDQFARRMLDQISDLRSRFPSIDLSKEEDYFLKMRKL